MKTQFLLPTRFKKLGLCMLVPFVIMAGIQCFSGTEMLPYIEWVLPLPTIYDDPIVGGGKWFTIVKDSVYDEIWIIGLLLSLTFIALAK